jgi:hypothetical protein
MRLGGRKERRKVRYACEEERDSGGPKERGKRKRKEKRKGRKRRSGTLVPL